MQPIAASIRLMTQEELYQGQQQNRGLMLEHQGHSYVLNAGNSDIVTVFEESVCLYVLTVNKRLDYVGLDAYMPAEPDPVNTVFLHSATEISQTLGNKWESMSPNTIATRLINYLY